MKYTLSPTAKQWLDRQPTDTADRLIELAASDRPIALAIARVLDLSHPLRTANKPGVKPVVATEFLIALREQGFSYRTIGQMVGLSGAAVAERIKNQKSGEQQ